MFGLTDVTFGGSAVVNVEAGTVSYFSFSIHASGEARRTKPVVITSTVGNP
jgi:hypothetical protein